ncbi:hypothetical protein BC829DRAFT_385082 [Chytridium lagenaria]|nr:hypothetical protein BC829DRAFT_385082 [Chytridium lagenaria]
MSFKQGAFITGGGSGICKGMAEALARHGAKVAITGRTMSKLEEAAADITKRRVFPVAADVRSYDLIESAIKQAHAKFGRIDYLVCGAAGNFLAPAEKLSPNAFRTVVEIDLIGTFNTCKAALPYLKETKGSIINVTATLQYTGLLSCIRINGVAPGSKLMPDGFKEAAAKTIPLRSYGTIKDIEHATVYLFSEAGRWVTGAFFVIDGGQWMTAVPGWLIHLRKSY